MCSLQGSVRGQGDSAFPSGGGGQPGLLMLQRNGAQTMNCREEARERNKVTSWE